MLGTAHGPPTFTKNNKFDGSNWIAFKNLIIVATEVCRAIEYLNGSIRDLLGNHSEAITLKLIG